MGSCTGKLNQSHFSAILSILRRGFIQGTNTNFIEWHHNYIMIIQFQGHPINDASGIPLKDFYVCSHQFFFITKTFRGSRLLTAHNWPKWKRVFLACPGHSIYRDEAVSLKGCKYTWKITIFVKMWNLGQYR